MVVPVCYFLVLVLAGVLLSNLAEFVPAPVWNGPKETYRDNPIYQALLNLMRPDFLEQEQAEKERLMSFDNQDR